ncbi:MAG: hypothetical protein V1906_03350 [Candidatus Woesearchaeota archaeon]
MAKESLEREVLKGINDLEAARKAKKSFGADYANLLHMTMTAVGIGFAKEEGYYIALRTQRYNSALEQLPATYQGVPVALMRVGPITSRQKP